MASTVMAYNNGIVFSFMRQDVGCSSSSESREVSEGAVAAERSEDMGERNSERPDERREASVGQSRFLTKGIEGQKLSAYKWWCLYRLSDIRSITTLYPKPNIICHTPLVACLYIEC